ncbi:MAG TPA: zinc-binding alcohol dehydrogenase family protein [Pseudolysinimonas sp.]|jgi:NADPH:quinone reductase-like Zn-dependent oxidoreductase
MKAAVVSEFGTPPRYQEFEEPTANGSDSVVVEVLAAALSPRVRSQASGSHYSSTGELPLIPGIDGVGRTSGGELRYFLLPDTNRGSMAQRTAIDARRSIPLPKNADPVLVAAAMNPVMSSWVALKHRANFRKGQSVMVLGANGNAGRLAVDVARMLGAAEVHAIGREQLADAEGLARAGSRVDVVLDYLWGDATSAAMQAIVPARHDDGQRLTWVEIGSVAGLEAPIPSAALRAINLHLVGSGQGSVDPRDIKDELRDIAKKLGAGAFDIGTRTVPLVEVEQVWGQRGSGDRVVLVP